MFLYALTWRELTVIAATSFQDESIEKIAHLLGLDKKQLSSPVEADLFIERSITGYTLRAKCINKTYHFSSVNDLIVNTITLISTSFLNQSKESVLHSGAVVIHDQAILFSGLPHAGKSTLALSAWLAKYPLINDDLLLYNEQHHTVSPFPKPLKPRLPSLTIPCQISDRAGANNLSIGCFLHDIGLFIGRRAEGMVGYDEQILVRSFFFIERGKETKVALLSRMQALVLALSQVMPNASCLKIGALINHLDKSRSIYHLTIADHDQTRALDIMEKSVG